MQCYGYWMVISMFKGSVNENYGRELLELYSLGRGSGRNITSITWSRRLHVVHRTGCSGCSQSSFGMGCR